MIEIGNQIGRIVCFGNRQNTGCLARPDTNFDIRARHKNEHKECTYGSGSQYKSLEVQTGEEDVNALVLRAQDVLSWNLLIESDGECTFLKVAKTIYLSVIKCKCNSIFSVYIDDDLDPTLIYTKIMSDLDTFQRGRGRIRTFRSCGQIR